MVFKPQELPRRARFPLAWGRMGLTGPDTAPRPINTCEPSKITKTLADSRADDLWNILMISHQHINNRDQMGFDGRMFENGVYLQVAIYIPGQ